MGVNLTNPDFKPEYDSHAVDYGLHTKLIRKSADESVASSTTRQNDDALLFAMAANEIWLVKIYLVTYSASDTPDMSIGFALPSGATLAGQCTVFGDTGVGAVNQLSGGSTPIIHATTTAYLNAVIHAVVVNSTTAGDFQLKWAQYVSNATATTMKANSCILATKLA